MSLTWNFAKVATPYGDVTTVHWAVPDDDDDENDKKSQNRNNNNNNNNKPKKKEISTQQKQMLEKAEFGLETAEDELGSVLWNSNSVAAKFLHQHFDDKETNNSTNNNNNNQNRKILELGAGVGCLGIGLAFGGMDVCVTDVPRLLPLMKVNVEMNRQKLAATGKGGKCFAAGLAWEAKNMDKDVEAWWFANKNKDYNNKNKSGEKKCIVLCDALYGNPKGWPPLIRLFEKLILGEDNNGNAEKVEIINFCEQRVKGVEDGFLKLLGEENEKNKDDEKISFEWVWDIQPLDEESEMEMPIRRTIIQLVSKKQRQEEIVNHVKKIEGGKESGSRRQRDE